MAATIGRSKRKAADGLDLPSKKLRRDDEEWEADSVESAVFSNAPSVAETSMTSRSSKRPKNYVCDYDGCGKAFDRPIRLEIHTRSHTNDRPYACEQDGCGKTFLRVEHLKRHMVDKHSDERSHVCTYDLGDGQECGKTFTTGTRLRRHVAAHEAKEDLKCTEPGCGKVYRKLDTLQRHIRQDHMHEKAFKCDHVEMGPDGKLVECDKAFSKSAQLKNHIALDHSGEQYFCDICYPALLQHEDWEEEGDAAPQAERIGFPTYAELQEHLKVAHPPTCGECGQQCESSRALKAHMDIEHAALSDRQQFPCDWPGCDRSFTKAGNLKVHKQNVHVKARKFVCGTTDLAGNQKVEGWNGQGCGSSFSTKQSLEEHIRTQHMGIAGKLKPCRKDKQGRKKKGVTFDDTADTPSTMDLDEATTPVNGTLSMLTGEGYEDRRPIACLISGCSFRFFRDYDLATHLELTHGWEIDDVNERMAEKAALEGQDFWIGGTAATTSGIEDPRDVELRAQLESALRPARPSLGVGNGAMEPMFEHESQCGGLTVNGMMGPDGNAMAIDPALMMES